MKDGTPWKKLWDNLPWIPAACWKQFFPRLAAASSLHLIMALADHFEPAVVPASGADRVPLEEQERRLERWCREYPRAVDSFRDQDDRPLCHTYFYPAEQYHAALLDCLAEHCHAGWGEVEVQLHHGVEAPDTSTNTRRILLEFRDRLVEHGCLSRLDGEGPARYAFVHGNWAVANSAHGRFCGVDDEMAILAETGCYAEMTLPAAPSPAQVSKINSVYECAFPLTQRAPHRRGNNLERGRAPHIFPLIVQGPLLLNFARPNRTGILPRIENGEWSAANPPTMERFALWTRAGIGVRGRPDWVFIKLHCHGMDPRDDSVMLGEPRRTFLRDLVETSRSSGHRLHFVTAREMVNILLAACDGREGNPGDYRDYRLLRIKDHGRQGAG